MHPHTARFGVKVSGVRNQAPNGPRADEHHVTSEQAAAILAARGFPVIQGGDFTENDLINLRNEITRLDGEADLKHQAADKLVEDIRAAGTDPLKDADAFEKVDAAYKEADELREQAAQTRRRADRVMQVLGKDPEKKTTGHGDEDDKPDMRSIG